MTRAAQEYRAALKTLGLSHIAAGELFHVHARTSLRWSQGKTALPFAVLVVLRSAWRLGHSIEEISDTTRKPVKW